MKCINHRIRTKKGIKYGYCVKYKKEVALYCSCDGIDVKNVSPLKISKLLTSKNIMKKATYKHYKKEKELINEGISVFGLVLGINQPPITKHFHWCHSTLTYQTDRDMDELREEIYKKDKDNEIYYYDKINVNQKYSTEYLIEKAKEFLPNNFVKSKVVIKRDENVSFAKYNKEKNQYEVTLSNYADTETLIHEMSHIFESENKLNEKNIKFKYIKNKAFGKLKKKDFELKSDETGNYYVIKKDLLNKTNFVSTYQSRLYIKDTLPFKNNDVIISRSREYFSVGMETYYSNPNLLKEKDISLYNFIRKEVFNGK